MKAQNVISLDAVKAALREKFTDTNISALQISKLSNQQSNLRTQGTRKRRKNKLSKIQSQQKGKKWQDKQNRYQKNNKRKLIKISYILKR